MHHAPIVVSKIPPAFPPYSGTHLPNTLDFLPPFKKPKVT